MSENFISTNISLTLEFDEYLVSHPHLLDSIPHKSYVIMLVKGDDDFNRQSYELVGRRKNVVQAIKSGKSWELQPA